MSTAPPPRKPARPAVVPRPQGLNCPGCGNAMTLRTFANAVNVTCPSCGSILDATDPKLRILQQAAGKQRIKPLLPLGTRGRWKGVTYEVVGFQERTITVDDEAYHWYEYLLFNPYAGYRYLTEYQGHWNDVTVVNALPKSLGTTGGAQPKGRVQLGDKTFTQFQSAGARTTYVLGEFPWQVRVNDLASATDFISPPFMLSSESTPEEVTWSLGEYTPGADIWKAFNMAGKPPSPQGVYANQPNPFGTRPKAFWSLGMMFVAAAVVLFFLLAAMAQRKQVFTDSYSYRQTGQEASFVTPVFDLPGHMSNVDIELNTNLDNNWAYFNFALINEETGEAYDFGREVSYYYGTDSDGSWSEGGRTDEATIGSIPPGKYYLRIEPEMDAGRSVAYTVRVVRDVPRFSWFWLTALALLIPPALFSTRGWSFEYKRWQESDYPIVTTTSSGDDD
jgi:hypothetical protein